MINCLVIDDEPLARKGLVEYIGEIDFLHLTGQFGNPLKALDTIREGNVKLLFLDIQMPAMNGLDFLQSLTEPPAVIFTTAFPEFAVEGFNVNAIDYLVKPIAFDRFVKAVNKARDHFSATKQKQGEHDGEYFYIKADNQIVKINWTDFIFAEAKQNYLCIQTLQKKYITYLTLKALEDYLPAHRFIKTHKSFIVDAGKINNIEGNMLRVGGYEIPVSRNLKEHVMNQLLSGHFLKR